MKEADLAGRLGELTVNGRKVRTPELIPVVNPNLFFQDKAVDPRELHDEFGFKMVITNSYIIRRSSEILERIEGKGLHGFLDFPGVIMTDSGTFQSYMYSEGGEVDVDPYEIVRFQHGIGSDVATILDRFTVPDRDHDGASKDLDTTLSRAKGSIELDLDINLAVPVQGGRHMDLRKRSGTSVRELGIGYAPIGGVVPIMESYDYGLLVDVIVNSKMGLGPSIPAHLFGAGHPMVLPLAVALGCDLFDSASYAKFARDDRYMTHHRTYHLKEMETLPCSCPECSRKDPQDILSLPDHERYMTLSRHNLWVLRSTLDIIRGSIKEGTLWELVERTAMYNPQMYAAVRKLKDHSEYLEVNSPRETRRFSCCSGLSLARPEFTRYRRSLGSLKVDHEEVVLLTDWTRAHSRKVIEKVKGMEHGEPALMVRSPIGPIPYHLIDRYPLSQSIFPPPGSLDPELQEYLEETEKWFFDDKKSVCLEWDGFRKIDIWNGEELDEGLLREKVKDMLDMQFRFEGSKRISEVILPEQDSIVLKRSRKTGKIRNVLETSGRRKTHLLSMRAEDGHLNLKGEAARRIHQQTTKPYMRVVVESETAEYNAQGFNVFCKFVKDAYNGLRPGDEVLVTDEQDRLHAVGVAAVPWRMMVEGRSGIAVKVREGITGTNDKDD